MSNFYLCPVVDCNKKYKTLPKLKDHVLVVHEQLLEKDPESVAVTKENKKVVENKKKNDINQFNREKLQEEIIRRKQIEEELKKKEEEQYIERFQQMERERLRLENETRTRQLEIQTMQAEFERKCQENLTNSEECCICVNSHRDTAVIPCGHRFFCYDCIDAYHKGDPQKGCPCCRGDILLVCKIYI